MSVDWQQIALEREAENAALRETVAELLAKVAVLAPSITLRNRQAPIATGPSHVALTRPSFAVQARRFRLAHHPQPTVAYRTTFRVHYEGIGEAAPPGTRSNEDSTGRSIRWWHSLAEDERNRIIKRTHEGRKVSQSRGVKMGRKEKLNELQKSEARRRLAAGELPVDLAPLYGVSRPTIARLRYSKRRG